MIYLRGPDVSGYQSSVPWDLLHNNGVGDVAIIKGGQGQITRDHVNQARAKGIDKIILYMWHDPTLAIFYQVLVASNDIKEHNPTAIFLDIEQWWGDWNQYWQFLAGELTLNQMKIVPPATISAGSLAVLKGIRTNFPDLLLGDYSAKWFVEGWASPMSQWIKDWPLWVAAYFDYGTSPYKVTYDYIKSLPPSGLEPALPAGAVDWVIWQISSRMIYPGQNYPYDTNIIKPEFLNIQEDKMLYDGTLQKDRINILTLWDAQAHADIQKLADGGTDVFILSAGGMDGVSPNDLYSDPFYRGRVADAAKANRPVIMQWTMAGDYHQNKQRTESQVRNMAWADNEVLKKIITSLRVDAAWDFATLSATDGKWLPVQAIMLAFYKTNYNSGQQIGNDWQGWTLENLVKAFIALQDQGKMPAIKIIVFATPDFFKLYSGNGLGSYLLDQRNRLFLGLKQPYFSTVPSATVMTTAEAWSYRVPDTFQFSSVLYGYGSDPDDPLNTGHVVYHEASYNRFLIDAITDANLKPTPPNTGFGYTTKEKFYSEFLNYQPGVPTTPDEWKVALAALEDRVKTLEAVIELHRL